MSSDALSSVVAAGGVFVAAVVSAWATLRSKRKPREDRISEMLNAATTIHAQVLKDVNADLVDMRREVTKLETQNRLLMDEIADLRRQLSETMRKIETYEAEKGRTSGA